MNYSRLYIGATLLATVTVAASASASAQPVHHDKHVSVTGGTAVAADSSAPADSADLVPVIVFQHFRPQDQRGLNVFEPPKNDTIPFKHFTLGIGAAFAMQYQGLEHRNTAAPNVVNGVDANQLITLGHGFNNPTANLYINAQVARGIRVALTTYLSSRHHQDTWVKNGYLLIDASPIDVGVLNTLMRYLTLEVGDLEVDYGDAHYRRSDNGNAMFNPLVGNYIMDAFTTEIGGEAYVRADGFMAMAGITGGEIHGQVTQPGNRAPSYLGKLGFDRQLANGLRVRLTGSVYSTAKSINNTLYSGDRAGSRYYDVMENTTSTESDNAWSGTIQPGFKSKVRAFVINPFVTYHGLEFFGNIEQASGRAASETSDRTWHQNVGEVVYRFLNDRLYVAGRYNTAKGELAGISGDVSVDRTQVGGGWYVLPTLLAKAEYMTQHYNDFPPTDIRNGGRINGFMLEGVVGF